MSNFKNRLTRLENSIVKTRQVTMSREEIWQWIDDTVQSINDGTYVPTPIEPLPPNASPAKIWLNNILNEME